MKGGQEAKVDRFLGLREKLRQGNVRIPQPFSKIATQLSLVTSKPTSGGGTQIILPRRAGTHMDAAAAAVIAFSVATKRMSKMASALLELTRDPVKIMRLQSEMDQQSSLMRARFGGR